MRTNILPGAIAEVGLLCCACMHSNPEEAVSQVVEPILLSVISSLRGTPGTGFGGGGNFNASASTKVPFFFFFDVVGFLSLQCCNWILLKSRAFPFRLDPHFHQLLRLQLTIN